MTLTLHTIIDNGKRYRTSWEPQYIDSRQTRGGVLHLYEHGFYGDESPLLMRWDHEEFFTVSPWWDAPSEDELNDSLFSAFV